MEMLKSVGKDDYESFMRDMIRVIKTDDASNRSNFFAPDSYGEVFRRVFPHANLRSEDTLQDQVLASLKRFLVRRSSDNRRLDPNPFSQIASVRDPLVWDDFLGLGQTTLSCLLGSVD